MVLRQLQYQKGKNGKMIKKNVLPMISKTSANKKKAGFANVLVLISYIISVLSKGHYNLYCLFKN